MSDAHVPTTDSRLWGLTVTTTAGLRVTFTRRSDDDGTAGVREPRKPRPNPPVLAVAIDPASVLT